MGDYINPPDVSKEQFLMRNAIRADITRDTFEDCPAHCLPVVLVYNGSFTAAGICQGADDLNQFITSRVLHQKKMFWVPRELLIPYITKQENENENEIQ